MQLETQSKAALFERIVTPHVQAAWNLARWLVRDPHDAEDVLQEASLRAFRFLDNYHGGDPKSWWLAIVRNLCLDCLKKNRAHSTTAALDDHADQIASDTIAPLDQLEQAVDAQELRDAIDTLPLDYREALILRELEGLSYKQISQIAGVPMGTVMSRLARAREKLVGQLAPQRAGQKGER